MIEIEPEELVRLLEETGLAKGCDYLDIRADRSVHACDIMDGGASCVPVDIETNNRLLFPLFNHLLNEVKAKQAKVDALMLEYCPEQIEEYEKNQAASE